MKTLFSSLIAGRAIDRLTGLAGSNPLVRLGAASLATRLITASVPLGIAIVGATALWDRHKKAEARSAAAKKGAATKRKQAAPRKRRSNARSTAAPQPAAA